MVLDPNDCPSCWFSSVTSFINSFSQCSGTERTLDSQLFLPRQWSLLDIVTPQGRSDLAYRLAQFVRNEFKCSWVRADVAQDRETIDYIIELLVASLEDYTDTLSVGVGADWPPRSVRRCLERLYVLYLKHHDGPFWAQLFRTRYTDKALVLPQPWVALDNAIIDSTIKQEAERFVIWTEGNRRRVRCRVAWGARGDSRRSRRFQKLCAPPLEEGRTPIVNTLTPRLLPQRTAFSEDITRGTFRRKGCTHVGEQATRKGHPSAPLTCQVVTVFEERNQRSPPSKNGRKNFRARQRERRRSQGGKASRNQGSLVGDTATTQERYDQYTDGEIDEALEANDLDDVEREKCSVPVENEEEMLNPSEFETVTNASTTITTAAILTTHFPFVLKHESTQLLNDTVPASSTFLSTSLSSITTATSTVVHPVTTITQNAARESTPSSLIPGRASLNVVGDPNSVASKVGTLLTMLETELITYNESGGFYSFLHGLCKSIPSMRNNNKNNDFPTPEEIKSWPLDPAPPSRINLQTLLEMALKDCPEEATPIQYLLDQSKFVSLFKADSKLVYPGRTTLNQKDVQQLLDEGTWEPISRRAVRGFVTAFTVPKIKKQTRRFICNAIPLNDRMQRLPDYELRLPGLDDLRRCVLANNWFSELDGKSWFNQFEIQPWMRQYLAVRVHNKTYNWTTLPMGWLNSVDVGHSASNILQAIPKPETDPLTCVDNLARFGKTREQVVRDTEKVLKRASMANAIVVSTTPPTTLGTLLGVNIDLTEKTMSLPDTFIHKITEVLQVLVEVWKRGAPITYKHAWALMGNLIWGLRVLHLPLFLLRQTLWWVRKAARLLTLQQVSWNDLVHLPAKVKNEILNVMELVRKNCPYKVLPEQVQEIPLFTDASQTGWGAVIDEQSIKVYKGKFPPFLSDQPIAIKELWAVIEGVKRAKDAGTVHIFCDNTNVVSWISKWHSNSGMGTRLLRKLYQELDGRDPRVTWIRSEENPADAPSRGLPFGGLGSNN